MIDQPDAAEVTPPPITKDGIKRMMASNKCAILRKSLLYLLLIVLTGIIAHLSLRLLVLLMHQYMYAQHNGRHLKKTLKIDYIRHTSTISIEILTFQRIQKSPLANAREPCDTSHFSLKTAYQEYERQHSFHAPARSQVPVKSRIQI